MPVSINGKTLFHPFVHHHFPYQIANYTPLPLTNIFPYMPGRRPQVMMLQAEGVAIDSCLAGHSMFVCQLWIAQKKIIII